MRSSDAALTAKAGTYIAGDTILDSDKSADPVTIDAGTSEPVVLSFPKADDATLDGQVTFGLTIEGAGTDSIGFGLADPAAS